MEVFHYCIAFGANIYPTFLVITPDGTIKDMWGGYGTGKLKQKMGSILNTDSASTISCSGLSSSSDGTSDVLESIQIHQIDNKKYILEVFDKGSLPAGREVKEWTVIKNFNKERGARISAIEGDSLISEGEASLDSIEPQMIISVVFKLKVPEKKGPFDATMRIHYKDIKNPSIIKFHGNAE